VNLYNEFRESIGETMKSVSIFLIILFSLVLVMSTISCNSDDVDSEHIDIDTDQQNAQNVNADGDVRDKTTEETSTMTPLADPVPDIIFFNGNVVTMDPDFPQAEALAVRGEDILAVGSNDEIQALSGPETKMINLGNRALLPGFVDPHNHILTYDKSTLEDQQQLALEGGTTTIGDAAVSPDKLDRLMEELEYTELRVRTSLYLMYNAKCSPFDGSWLLDYPPVLDPNEMLRFPGIKIFGDKGYYSNCGFGAMSIELPTELVAKFGGDPYGDLLLSVEELTEVISKHQDLGYQVIIHATGDRTVEAVLDAIEAALDGQPNTYRHRIEHNDFIRPELLTRYGEIGVVPLMRGRSWYPVCWLNTDNGIHFYGEIVHPWFYVHRSLIDANPGLPIAWHSDGMTQKYPIRDLYFLVTRKEINEDGVTVCEPPDWFAEQAITVEEALKLMTINAAYALFMEEKIGSLETDKFADLIILSDNPLTIDPDSLKDLEVLMTMVGGNVEYCKSGYEYLCPLKEEIAEVEEVLVEEEKPTIKLADCQ
jgi:predicted amidohydrolase YtcJ